jgi:hypothetical protein
MRVPRPKQVSERDGVPPEGPYAGARIAACLLQLATVDLTPCRYDTDGRRSDEHRVTSHGVDHVGVDGGLPAADASAYARTMR